MQRAIFMEHTDKLLLQLFLIFAGGKALGEIFERLRQPAVVGEILAGVILGPSVLALIQPNEVTHGLAEIGVIFLLFTVGLETKPRDLFQVGWTALFVATLGMIVPFAFGYFYMRAIDHGTIESIFVGVAMVATSVGITARVMADAGVLNTRVARVILGAAVIDDILGMIVLAVVSSLSAGEIQYLQLALVAAEAIGFSLLMIFFGSRVVRRIQPSVARLRTRNPAFIFSVILCLGLSLASVYVGMAAIIGAFLAGLALADHSEELRLYENAHPIYEFLAPFFFVFLGTRLDFKGVNQPGWVSTVVVVCALAILSKLIGCGLGALSLGWKDALRVGVGMVPRGEVGLIVASLGLNLKAISAPLYAVVLLMSMVTTIFAPPVLRMLWPRPDARGG